MIIDNPSQNDIRAVYKLYRALFPKKERIPFFLLKKGIIQKKANMLVLRKEGSVVSFAYLIFYKDLVYLFYFAVDKKEQKLGIGTEFLRYIKEKYCNKRLFLSVEQPSINENNIKYKRKQFYIKNGFFEIDYKVRAKKLIYDVMSSSGYISKEEYRDMFKFFGSWILPIYMKIEIL